MLLSWIQKRLNKLHFFCSVSSNGSLGLAFPSVWLFLGFCLPVREIIFLVERQRKYKESFIWNEEKKNSKENNFFMFDFDMKNIKDQTQTNFQYIFKFLSFYKIERNK